MRHRLIKHLAAAAIFAAVPLAGTAPAAAHSMDDGFQQRDHIEERARSVIGSPYSYGGSSPGGFDCSGLTRWTFQEHGADLPHSSMEQFNLGERSDHKRIWDRGELNVGDLVFHKTTDARVGHVGIYIGDDKFISATSSDGVQIRSIYDPYYWGPRWVGGTRLPVTMNTKEEYREENKSEQR